MNRAKTEAVAQADAYLNNADLPTYTETIDALRACQERLRVLINRGDHRMLDAVSGHRAADLLIRLAEVLP